MDYVIRLAANCTPGHYPLAVGDQAQWQSVNEGRWHLTLELPDVPSGHIIVPSFSMVLANGGAYRFQFTLQATSTHALTTVPSPPDTSSQKQMTETSAQVSSHIDCWHSATALEKPKVLLEVQTPHRPQTYLAVVSIRPLTLAPPKQGSTSLRAEVPGSFSQMEADPSIRRRICSPTALAMSMSRFENAPGWPETVAACYDQATKAYGVWPLAIQWASRHGVLGAVEVFSDWHAPMACLRAGVPLVCSIRFSKDQLKGAPLAQTGGHLVLLYGIEDDQVLVKDPAADSASQVDRRYNTESFTRAWLNHRGAAYVLGTSPLIANLQAAD